MTPDEASALEAWLDQYTDYLAGDRSQLPSLDNIAPELRGEARRQAFAISELWGREALASAGPSPVASAFGFDRLDERTAVDGAKLRTARRAAGLKVSELARELTRLGWSVSAAELGEIESGKRPDLPGTALPLLVAVLDVSAQDIAVTGAPAVDRLLSLHRVRQQVQAASDRLGRSFDEVLDLLRPQLAGIHYREHDSQVEDVAEIVQAILDRME